MMPENGGYSMDYAETPTSNADGDEVAFAGESLPEGAPLASEERIIDQLKQVYDPEIPVDIFELGLIYKIDCKPGGDVDIDMSLTAPGCPVAGEMPGQVARAAASAEGSGRVTVTLVWDPAWTPDRMSEDAKLALGMF